MNLVHELQKDHREIGALLERLKATGLKPEEKLKGILHAKELLIGHLKKEEEFLYPQILKRGEKRAFHLASDFAHEMKTLSAEVSAYFDQFIERLEKGNPTLEGFGTVLAKLTTRIRREETLLYPEYIEETRKVTAF